MIVYYRIYAEDGALPSNTTPVSPGDPFLGRIKFGSVPPPRPCTAKTVKTQHCESRDRESTSLRVFLTPYSQAPMDDDVEKVTTILDNGTTGPGSTAQEPPSVRYKDVRVRKKQLGVRQKEWTCKCCHRA